MGKVFMAAFIGRVLAALFIAVCAALGVGPAWWAAMILGSDPTLLARIVFLLLALATAAFVFLPLLRWPWTLVPLPEAAARAYTKTRAADTMDMGSPQGRIDYHIHAMLDEASKGVLNLYGKRPPGDRTIKIPTSRLNAGNYNSTANAIYAVWNDPTRVEYEQLSITWLALQRHIRRWKKIVAEHIRSGGKLIA